METVQYFNKTLRLFILNVVDTFPEFDSVLRDYYHPLLSGEAADSDKYVKRFMKKMTPYKQEIADKDESMFEDSLCVLKNVDFSTIFESNELSSNNREIIWEYIQSLFLLGEKLTTVPAADDSGEIDNLMSKMAENLKTAQENPNSEELFSKSAIGKLASEIAEEINPEELLGGMNINENTRPEDLIKNMMSGEGSANFMNLFQKVGRKVHEKMESGGLNQETMMSDAQQIFGNSGMQDMMSALNPTQERLRRKLEQRNKK